MPSLVSANRWSRRRRAGVAFALAAALGAAWGLSLTRAQESGDAGAGAARKPLPSADEIKKLPPDGGPEFNRLIFESSPYLLQHARNPVKWYPWGDAAFERARAEKKPVFLSIGYSTCHWCHVMERESFENKEVARILNDDFVAIKVDREERPDIDDVYMTYLEASTGSGGWPMSVFLTGDRKPFFAGTYFPPEDRFGRPGFKTVLLRVAKDWKDDREKILTVAGKVAEELKTRAETKPSDLGEGTLKKANALFVQQFDKDNGGFGDAPKFPRSHSLSFLLRSWDRSRDAALLAMVESTLDHMARGGIHDQVGGVFTVTRPTRSGAFLILKRCFYDQALLARTYVEAFLATGKGELRNGRAGHPRLRLARHDRQRRRLRFGRGRRLRRRRGKVLRLDSSGDRGRPRRRGRGGLLLCVRSHRPRRYERRSRGCWPQRPSLAQTDRRAGAGPQGRARRARGSARRLAPETSRRARPSRSPPQRRQGADGLERSHDLHARVQQVRR